MAVRINNTENIRKAKRWNESDDAALCILLKKKIKDASVAIRESDSPYERAKIKAHRNHYKSMLRKVEGGGYNGDIIFSELRAATALSGAQAAQSARYDTVAGAKKYNNSYSDMDFDYETAFRKKRYYGVGLPILLLLLSILLVGIFIMGAFLPYLPSNVTDSLSEAGVSLDSLFVYRIGEGNLDIAITNDGNWPTGTFANNVTPPTQGVPYEDVYGNEPETVKLNADLGMIAINITPFDVVKAWFRTPMLEKTRIDFLEDSKYFQGTSYYYLCFLSGNKKDSLSIKKDEDGNFDNSVIIRHIGTYGAILFLIIAFLLGIVSIIINIVRMFTYTSRKLHITSLLCFIFSLLCMAAPAFATIEGTEVVASFSNYFLSLSDYNDFLKSADATVGIGILFFIPAAISLIMMILPKLMKNVLKKRPTYVPRGNRTRNAYDDPYIVNEQTLQNIK